MSKPNHDRQGIFRSLYDRYHSRIYRSFPAGRVSREDRQDLTQEVFLRVYRGLDRSPDDPAGFERWLMTVARNFFRTWLKRSRSLEPFPAQGSEDRGELELADPGEPPQGTALSRLLENERAQLLHEAIEAMPDQMRACVLLRVGQDLTYREIAIVLGLAEGTVKAHLFRARALLRTSMGAYFEDFCL